MSKLIYFISTAAIAILISMVGIKAEAATDFNIRENTNYKVVGHRYSGLPSSYTTNTFGGGSVAFILEHQYNADWAISLDIFVKGISSFPADSTFSGYIAFPFSCDFSISGAALNYVRNMVNYYEDYYLDQNLYLRSQNGSGICYNLFSQGGTYWISVTFDRVNVNSLYRDTNNTAYISVNLDFTGGWIYSSDSDLLFKELDSYSNSLFQLDVYSGITSNWVSKCVQDVPLQNIITQGINAATDIDTIITLLNTIAGDTMTLTWVVDNIENLDAVLSAMYTYIQNEHTFFEGNLNSLKQYLLNIDGHIVSGSYQLDDILDILMASNQSVASLGTVLYNLSTTRTIANNLQILLQRVVAALGGPSANIWGDQTQFARDVTSHWIQIIREALSDFEIRIDIDNDNSIHIETTENQIVNIYNDHTIIQNFENNISFNFESYMSNIPFDLVNPSTGGPPGFSGTVTSGKNLIERMFNALGDYSYLVIVTLLVGLVAALIGPINRFVGGFSGKSDAYKRSNIGFKK